MSYASGKFCRPPVGEGHIRDHPSNGKMNESEPSNVQHGLERNGNRLSLYEREIMVPVPKKSTKHRPDKVSHGNWGQNQDEDIPIYESFPDKPEAPVQYSIH